MKSATYYITTIEGIKEQKGFTDVAYTENAQPVELGYANVGDKNHPCWKVTEVSTGLLCTNRTFRTRQEAHEFVTEPTYLQNVWNQINRKENAKYRDKINAHIRDRRQNYE